MKKDKSSPSPAGLLRRWISGESRLADERRLEQAAGEDPFLRETFDGYRRHADADHAASLQRLQERYQQQTRRKPVILYLRRYAAIAAAIVLAISLWQIIDRQAPHPTETLSDSRQMPALNEPASPAGESETPIPLTKKEKATRKPAKDHPAAGPTTPELALVEEKMPQAEENQVADIVESAAEESASPAETLSDKDLAFQETEMAAEKADSKMAKPSADTDDAAKISATSGAAPKNRILPSKKETAPGAQPDAEPVGGFAKLEKYVRKNLRYPAQAKENRISGGVTVQFIVLADGSLTQLEVVKGIGAGCDEEAMRLLREGPKWQTPKPPALATYTIYFEN